MPSCEALRLLSSLLKSARSLGDEPLLFLARYYQKIQLT